MSIAALRVVLLKVWAGRARCFCSVLKSTCLVVAVCLPSVGLVLVILQLWSLYCHCVASGHVIVVVIAL